MFSRRSFHAEQLVRLSETWPEHFDVISRQPVIQRLISEVPFCHERSKERQYTVSVVISDMFTTFQSCL